MLAVFCCKKWKSFRRLKMLCGVSAVTGKGGAVSLRVAKDRIVAVREGGRYKKGKAAGAFVEERAWGEISQFGRA
eukprot:6208815-Pleurochrysis_carterae.AAC.3